MPMPGAYRAVGGADVGSSLDSLGSLIPLTRPGFGQGVGNAIGERASGLVDISIGSASIYPTVMSFIRYCRSDGTIQFLSNGGFYGSTSQITGLRLLWSNGVFQNVGSIKLLGMRA